MKTGVIYDTIVRIIFKYHMRMCSCEYMFMYVVFMLNVGIIYGILIHTLIS